MEEKIYASGHPGRDIYHKLLIQKAKVDTKEKAAHIFS
jgi:hypothetical protein